MRRLARRLRNQGGYSLVELIVVMVILMTILTALTTLFVSGAKAELDANRRFQAQQEARLAADKLRREVHCAGNVTVTSPSSITVSLPSHCPTAVGGATTNIVYDTTQVSTNRFRLRRAGVRVADYLTSGNVFSYGKPAGELGKLHLDLPVNANPNEGWKTWRLTTDIVLRNTTRT
jgi:type II secretory pathway pseudopilin PulG